MKKTYLIFFVAALSYSFVQAGESYDISSVAPSGQTLLYNFINNGTELMLTHPNARNQNYPSQGYWYIYGSSYFTGERPFGNIIIPEKIHRGNIEIPVTAINDHTFECLRIGSVKIPNTVVTIGQRAFYNCGEIGGNGPKHLTKVEIGINVIEIGQSAFASNDSLETVICHAIYPPMLGSSCFEEGRPRLFVPVGSVDLYKNSLWGNYFDTIIGFNETLGINNNQPTEKINVFSENGRIHITGNGNTPAIVYDISGRQVTVIRNDHHSCPLPNGIYIVKIGILRSYKLLVL